MKKEIINIIKQGHDFKRIIRRGVDGNILDVMEKPNLKNLDPHILVSGAHVFTDPTFNHVDFFLSGASVFKEYPAVRGSTNYGYTLSGARIISENGN